jgi:hypothetical protein
MDVIMGTPSATVLLTHPNTPMTRSSGSSRNKSLRQYHAITFKDTNSKHWKRIIKNVSPMDASDPPPSNVLQKTVLNETKSK